MTQFDATCDVAIVGIGDRAAEQVRGAGFTATSVEAVTSSEFDETTHTWTLHTGDDAVRARIVVERPGRLLTPWIPDLVGRNEFRGPELHSSDVDNDFDPAGQRIAVIGTGAAPVAADLAPTAAAVKVFVPPRDWSVQPWRPLLGRWRPRRKPRPEPLPSDVEVVETQLDGILAAGAANQSLDTLIFATGYTVPGNTEMSHGNQPYLGMTMHGLPNYFVVTGRGARADRQLAYVTEALKFLARRRSTRIEVRRSTQAVFNDLLTAQTDLRAWRLRRPTRKAFDLSSFIGVENEIYDGPATLHTGDNAHDVRVRLTGHLDPIDGRYHWQGLILDALPDHLLGGKRTVSLTVGEQSADARIAERTPWGSYSVVGVGSPPFAMDDVEVAVPVS